MPGSFTGWESSKAFIYPHMHAVSSGGGRTAPPQVPLNTSWVLLIKMRAANDFHSLINALQTNFLWLLWRS